MKMGDRILPEGLAEEFRKEGTDESTKWKEQKSEGEMEAFGLLLSSAPGGRALFIRTLNDRT